MESVCGTNVKANRSQLLEPFHFSIKCNMFIQFSESVRNINRYLINNVRC